MREYKVYRSETFDKELLKYDKTLQYRVDKIEEKLAENPYYGTPLSVRWFREARFENYRVYYLIYEEFEAVYMVAISGKKDQQKVINTIMLLLGYFKEEIENLVKENSDNST